MLTRVATPPASVHTLQCPPLTCWRLTRPKCLASAATDTLQPRWVVPAYTRATCTQRHDACAAGLSGGGGCLPACHSPAASACPSAPPNHKRTAAARAVAERWRAVQALRVGHRLSPQQGPQRPHHPQAAPDGVRMHVPHSLSELHCGKVTGSVCLESAHNTPSACRTCRPTTSSLPATHPPQPLQHRNL
jgi:hypothetical protein